MPDLYDVIIVGAGPGGAGGRVKRDVLRRDLDHFLSRYAGRSIQELAAAQTVNEVMAVALRHRLQLPSELVMLFRVVGMSEGLGAQLDPDFRPFEFAAPYLQQFWLAQRSPKAIARRMGQARAGRRRIRPGIAQARLAPARPDRARRTEVERQLGGPA